MPSGKKHPPHRIFVDINTSDADLKVIDALGQLRPGTSDMDVVATQLRYLGSHPRLHSDTKVRNYFVQTRPFEAHRISLAFLCPCFDRLACPARWI